MVYILFHLHFKMLVVLLAFYFFETPHKCEFLRQSAVFLELQKVSFSSSLKCYFGLEYTWLYIPMRVFFYIIMYTKNSSSAQWEFIRLVSSLGYKNFAQGFGRALFQRHRFYLFVTEYFVVLTGSKMYWLSYLWEFVDSWQLMTSWCDRGTATAVSIHMVLAIAGTTINSYTVHAAKLQNI